MKKSIYRKKELAYLEEEYKKQDSSLIILFGKEISENELIKKYAVTGGVPKYIESFIENKRKLYR